MNDSGLGRGVWLSISGSTDSTAQGERNADRSSSIFEAHTKMPTLPSSGVSLSAGATDRACVWSEGRQPFARVERYLADVAAAYLITWRGSELSLIIRPNYQAGVDRRPTKRQTAFIHSLRVRLLELSYLLHQESWKTSLHPPSEAGVLISYLPLTVRLITDTQCVFLEQFGP